VLGQRKKAYFEKQNDRYEFLKEKFSQEIKDLEDKIQQVKDKAKD
jgi:prefoldin subunit 5